MKRLQLARPHAIMMVGLPGSGKSFFAEKFAETFTAPYIDSLSIEQEAKDAESAGRLITMMVAEVAKTNQTFIFEGNSDSRVMRTEFARWARKNDYHPLFIWVQTDANTCLKRTLKNGTLDQHGFEDVYHTFSPPHESEKAIVVSGKHTFASQVRTVLNFLTKQTRPGTAVLASPPPRPQASHGNRSAKLIR